MVCCELLRRSDNRPIVLRIDQDDPCDAVAWVAVRPCCVGGLLIVGLTATPILC
jgi:hypothetical protein